MAAVDDRRLRVTGQVKVPVKMFSTLSVLSASALISSTVALPVSRQASTWETLRNKITHVVYLTLENHSFDNIAGE
jgi:phospholipase C